MPKYRHKDRGTVIRTSTVPGPGWELADSPTPSDTKAPVKKAAPKKAAPKSASADDDKE